MKTVALVLVLAVFALAEDSGLSDRGRQKRLLFFDEDGSLVKTYSNPYMSQLSENGQNLPFYGNFLNPFFNFIRHFGTSLIAYTIPVSNAIIQAIKLDPSIQNTLVVIPKKDPIVAPNPLCEGKRTQVPSPNVCNNFLNCWDGWAFEQECPTGLLFSNYGYCDYADNVDCHNRRVESEKLQAVPQPPCSKDFEAFRNTQNCNEFFICVNRQPVRFQCPANLAYSQVLGVCDYADRVDCSSSGSQIAPSPQPSYPTPAPAPTLPPSPSADSPIIPDIPSIPTSPPELPSIPTSPPELPSIPNIPSSPDNIPSAPMIPAFPPSSPISSLPPTIPPAPASIPSLPSILPPGSVFPSIPPAVYPAQRPVPPIDVFPAPVPEGWPKPERRPLKFSDFFNPGCSSNNVAMSRQDAVHLLQKAIATNISY